MSDYEKERYYFLQILTDFFDSTYMKIISNDKYNYELKVFYLELLLGSTKNNGYLKYNDTKSYTNSTLSRAFGHDIEFVDYALVSFQELDLIQIDENGIIKMLEFEEHVKSRTHGADNRKAERDRKAEKEKEESRQKPTMSARDKSIDIREEELRDKNNNNNNSIYVSMPPNFNEVDEYCIKYNLDVDVDKFMSYYNSKNWMLGNSPMTDWRETLKVWHLKEHEDE